MQVKSGAGEFELRFERAEVREGSLILIGKMGVWEAETLIDQGDLGQLLRLTLRPGVVGWAVSRPFAGLWRRLRGGGPAAG